MFNNLYNNLSKHQKIGIILFIQVIIIICIIAIINTITQPKDHIKLQKDILSSIPSSQKELFKNQLWNIISSDYNNINKSIINDVIVRENTYNESENKGVNIASFIIDIDSIKQTYKVSIAWSDKTEIPNSVSISCPPQSEMKYPETTCYGMYNNTHSLNLYLPYLVYSENDTEKEYAPNYSIYGDEINKNINISVSACNPDQYKQQALEYLNTTPIKLDEYQIKYEINSNDINCN